MTTPRRPPGSPRRRGPTDGPRGEGRGPPRGEGRGPPRDRPGRGAPSRSSSRDHPMEPLAPEPPVLRAIQKVRTPHGTRVARRVTCTACGAQDTIDFAPKSPTDVLCRKCALEKRGVVDPDDAAVRTRRVRCVVCARWFEVVLDPRRPNHLPNTCLDCAHGVETQQKDRSKLATRVSPKVVRARRARPPAED